MVVLAVAVSVIVAMVIAVVMVVIVGRHLASSSKVYLVVLRQ